LLIESVGDFIDEEMLSWYYSILETLDEYQEGTGSTLSADVAELVATTTAVRHAITGRRPLSHDVIIDRAWESYDRRVDRAVGITNFVYAIPGVQAVTPAIRAGQTIGRWTAQSMKFGMQLFGYDEMITTREVGHHSPTRKHD
jgi:hypothetical protein